MSVEEAFEQIQRKWFLPRAYRARADADMPLPIGYGQTNSQPYTVRQMLRWLDVQEGQKILDVGSGSGWTTALLGYLVGDEGRVFAVEILPELVEMGKINCKDVGIKNAKFYKAQKVFGLKSHAPFDRILVSAGATELPQELIDQLKVSGKMVIPVGDDILEVTKHNSNKLDIITHSGFRFVPLLSK